MTNWVSQNAAVRSNLSTRARTLSQRRRSRHRNEGVDLSGQDASLDHRDSWVPADEHSGHHREVYEDDDLEDDDAPSTIANGETRGRENERLAA